MTTSPATYFSREKRDYRHVNMANTVLVNLVDSVWYLGYVQDIDGDKVFVDFNCTKIPPFWTELRHLWRHQLLTTYENENLCTEDPCFVPAPLAVLDPAQIPQVHVALPDEEDGPYIFRPARFLGYTWVKNFAFGYVCVDYAETSPRGQFELVHRWQLVEELPVNQPPLSVMSHEISFVKHVFCSEMVNRTSLVDECTIRKIINTAFRPDMDAFSHYDDRVYVRIDNGKITFVMFEMILRILEMELRPEPDFWTGSSGLKLSAAIGKCFVHCQEGDKEAITPLYKEAFASLGRLSEEEDSLLHCLTSSILREVLSYLDMHSQTTAQRVCLSWYMLLKGFSNSIITLDFHNLRRTTVSNRYHAAYDTAFLLHNTICSKTKALALVNLGKDDMYFRIRLVSSEIRRKNIVLMAILVKNCGVSGDLDWKRMEFANNDWDGYFCPKHQTVCLSVLLPMCRRLVLSEYIIDGPFKHCSNVRFVIPKMIFDCGTMTCSTLADFVKVRRRFLACLEPYLPPVEQCVQKKFKQLHAKWVTSRDYPHDFEWRCLKSVLQLHAVTERTASDSFWNDLDLRNFDDLPISKLSWQSISYMHGNPYLISRTSYRLLYGIILFLQVLLIFLKINEISRCPDISAQPKSAYLLQNYNLSLA